MSATDTRYQTLLVEIENHHCQIRLNRPEKRNALNAQMVNELTSVFNFIRNATNIRSVLIKGDEQAFCSGADLEYLKQMRGFDHEANVKDSKTLGNLFLNIYTCPKPVLAVVEGAALAGGCGLATVCDFIYATPEARFGYPEVRIGFIAALVSTFLIRQVGKRRARELLLSGDIISAGEALNLGLVTKVCAREDIDRQAGMLVKRLQENSSLAMARSKLLLNGFLYRELSEDINHLAEVNAHFRTTEDFVEGISAFLEKRKPNWIH